MDKEAREAFLNMLTDFAEERTEGHPVGIQVVGEALRKFEESLIATSHFLDRQGVPRGKFLLGRP